MDRDVAGRAAYGLGQRAVETAVKIPRRGALEGGEGTSGKPGVRIDSRFQAASAGFGSTALSAASFDSITSGTFSVQAVPEPGTMAALGLGAAALLRRRRSAR